MTSSMLSAILEFAGSPDLEREEEYDPLDSYERSPDFYRSLVVEAVSLKLSYKSKNVLKRMEGIKVAL